MGDVGWNMGPGCPGLEIDPSIGIAGSVELGVSLYARTLHP